MARTFDKPHALTSCSEAPTRFKVLTSRDVFRNPLSVIFIVVARVSGKKYIKHS